MEDTKVMVANDDMPEFDGLTLKESRELKTLLARFLHSYGQKAADVSDEEWLKHQFLVEIPNISEEKAENLSKETIKHIKECNDNLESLNTARKNGMTTDEWFVNRCHEAAVGMSAAKFGYRMEELGDVLSNANAQLYRTVSTLDGGISQANNLDGFLAEQYHVNSFNEAAKLSGTKFYAEVCAPAPGAAYQKNSFDVVIRDESGKIAHQYQMKYGADAKSTIQMLRRGNYNNQTIVVPLEQVEEVRAAFPGKTVVSQIGGTEKVPVASKPLTKEDVKAAQNEIQRTAQIPEQDWNTFDDRMLGKYVAQQAALAGIQGAVLTAGFHMAAKLAESEPIEAEEVVTVALKGGVDTGVKAAASGALITASERGIIAILPKGTPVQSIVSLVCVTIENVKILGKVFTGELTIGEALDRIGCNTTAMYCGLGFGASGALVGAFALGWIPIAGPILGGLVGGLIGYTAGSKFGEGVYNAVKSAAKAAVSTVKKMAEGVKNAVGRLAQGVNRLFNFA